MILVEVCCKSEIDEIKTSTNFSITNNLEQLFVLIIKKDIINNNKIAYEKFDDIQKYVWR